MQERWSAGIGRAAPVLWSFLLAVLMLGPALAPGFVLSYDMVWVPDLALTRDALGLGSALPRAVPSDAVVAGLDEVLPAALLQKVVLLGCLTAAGAGCAQLVGRRSLVARLVAVSLAVWNPYVAERLVLGHWPLLIGYAVIPWMAIAVRREAGSRLRAAVPVLMVLGSLSASAGLMTALVALTAAGRVGMRRTLGLLVVIVCANAPWVVAGIVSPASRAADPVGALVFATGDEGRLSGPLAALSLGGVWNADVVPVSRLGTAGVAMTVLLVAAALCGSVLVARGASVEHLPPLIGWWCVGWGLAALSWAAPGALGWFGEHVPAGGVVRDGSRLLGLAVPLVVVLVSIAVDALLERLPEAASRAVVGAVLALVPVSLMPDAAGGVGGRLDAVSYPPSYAAARRAVEAAPVGDALSLPFVSYRAPEWNGYRPVLDPLGRFLGRPTVVDDDLVVSGRVVAGEDPRSAAVRDALLLDDPDDRAAALRAAGVSVAVSQEIDGYPVPEVGGQVVLSDELTVTEIGPAMPGATEAGRALALWLAWGAWLMGLTGPLLVLGRRRVRARRR